MSLLSLRGVDFGFAGQPVLAEINLDLAPGEVLVLLGPSGCGKTSLLRLMAGLVQPDRGEVRLLGGAPRPGVGCAMVFQSYRLLPWKRVAANIGFALPFLPRPAREARIREVLEQVGLGRVAKAWPHQLSGGMRQRVALARALAVRPDVLLMDEPFAALDAQARELMQGELGALVAGARAPGVVFVTHSVDEALLLGDRILLLTPRPGRIDAEIVPEFAGVRDLQARRDHPAFGPLRDRIWQALRAIVLHDPGSDFFRPAPGSGPPG